MLAVIAIYYLRFRLQHFLLFIMLDYDCSRIANNKQANNQYDKTINFNKKAIITLNNHGNYTKTLIF